MRSIKIFGKNIEFNLPSEADESVFEEVFVDLDYKKVDEIIKKATTVILDIGAHIGCFSVYCSILNPVVPVVAFEPESKNFLLLKEHLKINRAKNVRPKNLAVAGSDGVGKLFISDDSHNHSLIAGGNGDVMPVNITTLDRALSSFEECDLVKMDCEGAEVEIFNNVSTSALVKVQNFYIEYHMKDKVAEMVKILQSNGFKTNVVTSRYDNNMGFIFASRT